MHKRREEYSKDITYVENSELGFDYLRDNLVKSMKDRSLVRRPLNYAIVDEVDSILIDEARTPLIISEPNAEATEKYIYYAQNPLARAALMSAIIISMKRPRLQH